jgi:hypothetical protein
MNAFVVGGLINRRLAPASTWRRLSRRGLSSSSRNACKARVYVSSMPGTYCGTGYDRSAIGGILRSLLMIADDVAPPGQHHRFGLVATPTAQRSAQNWDRDSSETTHRTQLAS